MIISREYVPFTQLINTDPDAKEIIQKAFKESYSKTMDKVRYDQWYAEFIQLCLYQRDMGWCLIGIGDLVNGFKRLDKEKPYDNGLSYDDVNDIDIWNKDENGITLALLRVLDGYKQIVAGVDLCDKKKNQRRRGHQ